GVTSYTLRDLKPPQRYRLDDMIGALFEDQGRARPRRQDVFLEIGEIGALPYRGCSGDRLFVRQRRIAVGIGLGIVERGVAQRQPGLYVPFAEERLFGVDFNRTILKVGAIWL